MSVAMVKAAWRAIWLPWSQVRVPFITSGRVVTCLISALYTLVESLPLGSARMVRNRLARSTRVIAALRP